MTGPRSFLLVNCALSILTVVAWHAVRITTTSHAPTIKIRWKETVTDAERRSLEQTFQLVNAEATAPRSFNYDLIDSRQAVIKAIVQHAAVDATGDLDPVRFTISTAAERGDTVRWLWHRWAMFRSGQIVTAALHLWLLASAAVVGMSRYVAWRELAKRTMAQTPLT